MMVSTESAPAAALEQIYRDLVGIHASLAGALRDDPELVPWTLRELRDVLRYIQAVKQGQRADEPGQPV